MKIPKENWEAIIYKVKAYLSKEELAGSTNVISSLTNTSLDITLDYGSGRTITFSVNKQLGKFKISHSAWINIKLEERIITKREFFNSLSLALRNIKVYCINTLA